MHFLRQPISTIPFKSDHNSTYETLLEKLQEMGLEVVRKNKITGEIVIRCLSILFNMVFWKSYGDKLLFQVKETGKNETKVEIFGIPNLFKIKVRKGEKLEDLDKLVTQLRTNLPPG